MKKLLSLKRIRLLRKIVSGIILTLLLISMLTLVFNIHPVKGWSGTVYIRADGSIDPPDAPIITYDKITYTLIDNIISSADGIVIERDNIIIDGASHEVQGSGKWPYRGIYLYGRSNVTIKNIKIRNFHCGIHLEDSLNNIISSNNIANNSVDGIFLIDSLNNTISSNNITNNSMDGIFLIASLNNIISSNDITNNKGGIALDGSSNNIVSSNDITNNECGIFIMISLNNIVSSNNSISRNNITNNSIYGIFLINSSNNIINSNNITNNSIYGIFLEGSSNNIISSNDITNSNDSIDLAYSSNNIISSNNIANNSIHGIGFHSSSNNSISSNNITNNKDGIILMFSLNNIISSNNITNNKYGIHLEDSSNNIINSNNITNNKDGIFIMISLNNIVSSNNSISRNNITNNECGIWLYYSSKNVIYHNDFINNINQVYLIEAFNNTWDNGYPSGGNYWSDYADVDLYKGPYQNENGSDGIWDHPYIIDAYNKDRYPLVKLKKIPGQSPDLILFSPEIDELTVIIDGVATPGTPSTSITRIHWDWGDGYSEDSSFPAFHIYDKAGTYKITVTAYQSNGLSTSKSLTVTLVSFNIELSAHPQTQSVLQGNSINYEVSVELVSGTSQTVSLSLSDLPPEASYSFNPPSGNPPFTSTLTITTSKETPEGQYALTIIGSDGGKMYSTTVTLNVLISEIVTKEETTFQGIVPSYTFTMALSIVIIIGIIGSIVYLKMKHKPKPEIPKGS